MKARAFHLFVEHHPSTPMRVVAVFARQAISITSMRWEPPDANGGRLVEVVVASTETQADLLARGLRRLPEVLRTKVVDDA